MALESMCAQLLLPVDYPAQAQQWFAPIADELGRLRQQQARPVVLGIHGCQGSGKSTLAEFLKIELQWEQRLVAVVLSLDDFYLSHQARQQLAVDVHPLLAIRGVPGTHDVALARQTLHQLLATGTHASIRLPAFDKLTDDCQPTALWRSAELPIDVIILEGWCLGVPAQEPHDLVRPVNALEAAEDPAGVWRSWVNEALRRDYQPLFAMVDQWLMLQAPAFASVYQWRLEQEQKLAKKPLATPTSRLMNEQQLARFVQHYQRLTEHALRCLPSTAPHLFTLCPDRSIARYQRQRC